MKLAADKQPLAARFDGRGGQANMVQFVGGKAVIVGAAMSVAVLDKSIGLLIGSPEKSMSHPLPPDTEGSWVVHAKAPHLEGIKWE